MIVYEPYRRGCHRYTRGGREVNYWGLEVDYRKTVSIIFFKGLWGGIGAVIGTLQAQHQILPQSIVYLGQFVRG